MSLRREYVFLWTAVLASLGFSYRTTNFVVEAPTQEIAQTIGQAAEQYRREKALQWIGQEMPPWPEPCPLNVKVTMNGAGGATSFAFDRGRVLGQHMQIEGAYDRLVSSVLPHEVTHTVFAYYFRCALPRWADEGGAVLSEDDAERNRHDKLCREILNTPGRMIPLRRLFALREYPSDVMALYAEGFSVSNFLVGNSNRQTFLAFIGEGMRGNWDAAANTYYHYRSVEELEQAWLAHMRATRRQPPTQLAAATTTTPVQAELAQRIIVRQTAPPVQPLQTTSAPVYRGANPGGDQEYDRPPVPHPAAPAYPPDYQQPNVAIAPPVPYQPQPQAGYQQPPPGYQPPIVYLGQPQFPGQQ